MHSDHIKQLQAARIDAANALADAEAVCREAFKDGLTAAHDITLKAVNAARFALYDAEQALSAALTKWHREIEDEQRDEEQRASEARAALPTEITTGTTDARQWLCAARGECNVTVTVDYAAEPPRVLVEEEAPGFGSLDHLDAEGWTGGGFGGDGAGAGAIDGATLRALRTEALDAAAKRWRVVRRRLDAARRTASAA